MKKNFISVIIPAHNEENCIAKAINSVLSSTYKNYEIIVVNDGSTDKTQEIVENFVKKVPQKIRLLNFEPIKKGSKLVGRGPAFARNRGAEVAKGDILFFLDADDWITENTLQEIIEAFDRHKNIDFICGNRKVILPKDIGKIYLYGLIARNELEIKIDSDEIITDSPELPCPFIVKKEAFKKIGLFDEKFYYIEDSVLSKKISEMQYKKLLTKKITYYTDMRSSFKDFLKSCKNVSRSLRSPLKLNKLFKINLELAISVLLFPVFYLGMFIYIFIKTEDINISVFSPFLYIIRRIIILFV